MKSYTTGNKELRFQPEDTSRFQFAVRRTGEKKKFCLWKGRKEYESQTPEFQVPGPAPVRAPEPAPQTQSSWKNSENKIAKEFVWKDVQGRVSLASRQRTEAKLIGETKIKYH